MMQHSFCGHMLCESCETEFFRRVNEIAAADPVWGLAHELQDAGYTLQEVQELLHRAELSEISTVLKNRIELAMTCLAIPKKAKRGGRE